MTDWTARAQAFFSNEAPPGPDETDATHVSAVSSVASPELFAAADRACDHWSDGAAARAQMRQDISNTPAHLHAELLEHLHAVYPKAKK
jgi:hypothetical protein